MREAQPLVVPPLLLRPRSGPCPKRTRSASGRDADEGCAVELGARHLAEVVAQVVAAPHPHRLQGVAPDAQTRQRPTALRSL